MAKSRYTRLIEHVFFQHYSPGDKRVEFDRSDLVAAANELDIELPKNLGDVVYSFRYRTDLPDRITKEAPPDKDWVIKPAGRSKYVFALTSFSSVTPRPNLKRTKIPESTPGIIEKYALSDEQALLAKIRYNRLIDMFTSLTCYSLQSHLRTFVKDLGQVETDEVYVGLDNRGVHYVIPVQAKGSSDNIGVIQIEQDLAMCHVKFPNLVPIPIAAQFLEDDGIALFSFESQDSEIVISKERHYSLVAPEELTEAELIKYRTTS